MRDIHTMSTGRPADSPRDVRTVSCASRARERARGEQSRAENYLSLSRAFRASARATRRADLAERETL